MSVRSRFVDSERPKFSEVEVVAHRRAGERVLGEVRAVVLAEAAAVRDEEGLVEVAEPGQRVVAGRRRRPTAGRRRRRRRSSGCPRRRRRRRCLRSARRSPPSPPSASSARIVGAEGDAAVGLAGHVDAEADARDRPQVVGRVAVLVDEHAAVVVDVVAEAEPGVAEQRDALRRRRCRRSAGPRRWWQGVSCRFPRRLHLVSGQLPVSTRLEDRRAAVTGRAAIRKEKAGRSPPFPLTVPLSGIRTPS